LLTVLCIVTDAITGQGTKPLAAVNGIKPSVFILHRYNAKSDMGSACEVK